MQNTFHFVPFTVIGDPNYKKSLEVVKAYVKGGASMLELGLPWSDPTADGPVVQAADERAIRAGMNTDRAFDFIKDVRRDTNLPIGLLVYYNLIYKYGVERFYRAAAEAGVTSILVADLPVHILECEYAADLARRYGLQQIFIVSELTTPERLKIINRLGSGFLYFVSSLGVTGARKELSPNLSRAIQKIKKNSKLPVLVGFGVSERRHLEQIKWAGGDGAIVGSKLVELIEQKSFGKIPGFIKELTKGI